MDPPRPDVAVPEPTYSAPLLPELDVPLLSTSQPLTPLAPALPVCSNTLPLDVAELYPPIKYSCPPLPDAPDVVPAVNTNSPPDPELPDPTVT